MSQPVVALVGATASGKSGLGLDLAERLGGEVVNTDAMQVYRGMDIGTAKLPLAQRRGVPHHLLDMLEVTEPATVAGSRTVRVSSRWCGMPRQSAAGSFAVPMSMPR